MYTVPLIQPKNACLPAPNFYKEDNFCDFLFVSSSSEKESTPTDKNKLSWRNFFPFSVDLFRRDRGGFRGLSGVMADNQTLL